MSLRRIAPRIVSQCNLSIVRSNGTAAVTFPNRACGIAASRSSVAAGRRRLSSAPPKAAESGKPTPEEVEAALEKANKAMEAYYSYPPEKVIAAKKLRFEKRHRDKQFYFQLGLGVSLLCSFLITPFLGRKIAYDEEFKEKYIPKWYDYTLEKPKSAWTKEELHQELMRLQRELRERAIAGDFTPEKLEEMRRNLQKKPEREEHAHFAKLHPGVDDDEDVEDD